MSVYHSPGIRITSTDVHSNGVNRDIVIPDRAMALWFTLQIDPNMRFQPAYFNLNYSLIQDGQRFGHTSSYWSTQFPQGSSLWFNTLWRRATDATNGNRGLFLYRPTISVQIITPGGRLTGNDEFAVAEEDHYIFLE